jgi:hypothetical protein
VNFFYTLQILPGQADKKSGSTFFKSIGEKCQEKSSNRNSISRWMATNKKSGSSPIGSQ